MSELERALRGAFAMDAVPEPRPGFEARLAGAARERRALALPGLLAAAVAGAAIATLLIGRGGEQRAAPAARPPQAGGGSVTQAWELVVELRHRFSWSSDDREKREPFKIIAPEPPPPAAPRERRPAVRRPVDQVECGDDPLCPLVAPSAARVSIAAAGGRARVTLDGQDAGATPLEIDVIPGDHMFEVRWEDGRTKKVFATLRSGDHRSIRVSPR
jgi:hypothetical protein